MYANSLRRYFKSAYNGRKMSQKISTLPSIAVCLSSFNGFPWLSEQIDSIHRQSGVALTVLISVDISSDGTEKWIDQAARPGCTYVIKKELACAIQDLE